MPQKMHVVPQTSSNTLARPEPCSTTSDRCPCAYAFCLALCICRAQSTGVVLPGTPRSSRRGSMEHPKHVVLLVLPVEDTPDQTQHAW